MIADDLSQLPVMLKIGEVCDVLRYCEPTVRDLIACGRLRGIRKGRSIRVSRDSVRRYIAGETEAK